MEAVSTQEGPQSPFHYLHPFYFLGGNSYGLRAGSNEREQDQEEQHSDLDYGQNENRRDHCDDQAETRINLYFDVDVPGLGMDVDGERATSVTVIVETGPDDLVHITVTDADQDPGGVGDAPRIW